MSCNSLHKLQLTSQHVVIDTKSLDLQTSPSNLRQQKEKCKEKKGNRITAMHKKNICKDDANTISRES